METKRGGADAAIDAVLTGDPDLTGLIVYDERMLSTVVDRLEHLGHDVPRDVSIVAICSDMEASKIDPEISNVALPLADIGRLAFTRLAEMIDGDQVPTRTVLTPELHARSSARRVIE